MQNRDPSLLPGARFRLDIPAAPFTDVTGGFYFNAVLWAVENRITNGMTADTFAPGDSCTRGRIVTFLYRDIVE